jgi:hypothetical protein
MQSALVGSFRIPWLEEAKGINAFSVTLSPVQAWRLRGASTAGFLAVQPIRP